MVKDILQCLDRLRVSWDVAMVLTYKRVAPYIRTYTPDVGCGVELEVAASYSAGWKQPHSNCKWRSNGMTVDDLR